MRVGFDDQLIMDVHDNGAAAQRLHGVTEDVAGGCLHDVFHKFRAVGIESFPFLCGANAFIGDAFAAELVRPDLRLHIGKVPARRKRDKEHPGAAGEGQTVATGCVLILDRFHDCTVDIPPELDDARICLPPSVYQRRKLVL